MRSSSGRIFHLVEITLSRIEKAISYKRPVSEIVEKY
jgi:hypothetical protein